jgi:hypothetical protein
MSWHSKEIAPVSFPYHNRRLSADIKDSCMQFEVAVQTECFSNSDMVDCYESRP